MSIAACYADIMPSSSSSIGYWGIGVLNLPSDFVIYAKPDFRSEVLNRISLKQPQSAIVDYESPLNHLLIAQISSLNLAFAAVETNQEDGWFEIYINQKTGQTGWVRMPDFNSFMTWKNFFYHWGKKNGLYIFKDIPENQKRLYSQDSNDSQTLESFSYPKYINFSIIRGNWMLVNVLDLGNSARIGWLQWRGDDGKIYLFPNLN